MSYLRFCFAFSAGLTVEVMLEKVWLGFDSQWRLVKHFGGCQRYTAVPKLSEQLILQIVIEMLIIKA